MLKYAIVALVGALAGAICVLALRPEHGESESPVARGSTHTLDRKRPADRLLPDAPTGLTECRRELVRSQIELRVAQATAERARAHDRLDAEEPDAPTSSSLHASSASEANPEDAPQVSERQRQREATEKVRDALIEHLGISEDEQSVLADLVCSQRDNERGLMSEFANAQMDVEALFRAIAQERELATEGMRRELGSRRYRTLRRLGAFGILAPRLCKRQ